jgi:hypothetical protein
MECALDSGQFQARRVFSQKAAHDCHFPTHIFSRIVVRIAQRTGQELMARVTHAVQIDLRLRDPARELSNFGVGVCPGNFARERFHLFGQGWIGTNGQAQPVAKRVSGRASAALGGLRPGADPRIRAVGLDLAVARQAAFFPLAGVVSITSNSPSSILHAPSQCFAQDHPTPIDLVQAGVTAALGDGGLRSI